VVPLVTCTITNAAAFAARSPSAHANVWLPGAPVTLQIPGPVYGWLTLQLSEVAPGVSRSLMVAEVAAASTPPAADATFLKYIQYPIGEPAATEVASATLVNSRHGPTFG
jgi:hypothetical protein